MLRRKILAIMLTLSLTLTLMPMSAMPMTAFAVSNTDVAMSVTEGDSGNCGLLDEGTGEYGDNATFTISDGVLTIYGTGHIGRNAFYKRKDFTSVVFAEGSAITGFGFHAFYDTNLRSITIPDSVETMSTYVFQSCRELSSVTWGSGCTSIKSGTFANCSSLKSFTVPDTVTTIESLAFSNSGLTSITIADTVTSLQTQAFQNCRKLEKVKWSKSRTLVTTEVFNGCTALGAFYYDGDKSELEIGENNGPLSDGSVTFYNLNGGTMDDASLDTAGPVKEGYFCDGWYTEKEGGRRCTDEECAPGTGKEVYAHWIAVDDASLQNCGTRLGEWPEYFYDDDAKYTLTDGLLRIYGTGEIGVDAFSSRTDITSIVFMPGSKITKIDGFSGCTNLTGTLTIPNTVTELAAWAFHGAGLTGVTVPSSVTTFGNSAFYRCYSLTNATWNSNIVGDSAFKECTALRSVVLPTTLTTIGQEAFNGCSSLVNIVIPNTVTTIGQSAFRATGITDITIPDSVTSMGNAVFRGCTGLVSASWNDTLTTVPAHTFNGCTALNEITLGRAVTSIGSNAFYGVNNIKVWHFNCENLPSETNLFNRTNLEEVSVGDAVVSLPMSFCANATKLTKLYLGASLFTIGTNAFSGVYKIKTLHYNCINLNTTNYFPSVSNLETLTIGDSVDYIPQYRFENAPITNVRIGDNVTSVGSTAFNNCGCIETIKWSKNSSTIRTNTLHGCTSITSFYYDGSLSDLTIMSNDGFDPTHITVYNLNGGDILDTSVANPVPVKDGYIFDGWYTELEGGNLCTAEQCAPGTGTEVYAHWSPIVGVMKASSDKMMLSAGMDTYGGLDLFGAQIRQTTSNEGLRFVTSLSEDLLDQLSSQSSSGGDVSAQSSSKLSVKSSMNDNRSSAAKSASGLSDAQAVNNVGKADAFDGTNVRYGYVIGTKSQIHVKNLSESAELIKGMPGTVTVDCTKPGNSSDLRNFKDYRIFSLVITYSDDNAAYKATDLIARAYITYTDSNGIERTYYSTYTGTTVRGGICTNYIDAESYVDGIYDMLNS